MTAVQSEVKTRPVIFSTSMVRAILDGRKTQTRRLGGLARFNTDPDLWDLAKVVMNGAVFNGPGPCRSQSAAQCPFGAAGHRLWVREAWHPQGGKAPIIYVADSPDCSAPKRSPIHLPRRLSRIDLEITGIRVARLQDITEKEALSEGIDYDPPRKETWWQGYDSRLPDRDGNLGHTMKPGESPPAWMIEPKRMNVTLGGITAPVTLFQLTWDHINGKTHPWSSNPWVWVIEFKRIDRPADLRR